MFVEVLEYSIPPIDIYIYISIENHLCISHYSLPDLIGLNN
jgi:hypothetical protein